MVSILTKIFSKKNNLLSNKPMYKIKDSGIDNVFNILNNVFLLICLLIVLFPLIYIVAASLSSPQALMANKVWLWPVDFDLMSYEAVFKNESIGAGYINSIIYLVLGTFISVSLTLLLAYPLSRKEFFGRNLLTKFIMLTMLFSGGLIPLYLQVRDLGLYNTRWAVILPNAVSVLNVIIARSFLQEVITDELYDAAQIDGCSDFKFFFTIVVPLSGAVIAVLSLFYAVVIWNSYFDAFIFLQDSELYPLQIVLRNILLVNKIDPSLVLEVSLGSRIQGLYETIKYSVIVVSTLPLLVLYPFVQKYFVKGAMIGSLKG